MLKALRFDQCTVVHVWLWPWHYNYVNGLTVVGSVLCSQRFFRGCHGYSVSSWRHLDYREIGIFVVVHERDCNCIFFLSKEDFLNVWLWFWKVVQNGDICNGHSNLERIQDKTQTETNGHVYNGTAVMNASSQSNTHVRQRQTGKENQESASDGQDSCKSSLTEEHVQVRLLI